MLKSRYLPYRNVVLNAVIEAERRAEGPVYFIDVIRQFGSIKTYLPRIENLTVLSIIYDLYREDEV